MMDACRNKPSKEGLSDNFQGSLTAVAVAMAAGALAWSPTTSLSLTPCQRQLHWGQDCVVCTILSCCGLATTILTSKSGIPFTNIWNLFLAIHPSKYTQILTQGFPIPGWHWAFFWFHKENLIKRRVNECSYMCCDIFYWSVSWPVNCREKWCAAYSRRKRLAFQLFVFVFCVIFNHLIWICRCLWHRHHLHRSQSTFW